MLSRPGGCIGFLYVQSEELVAEDISTRLLRSLKKGIELSRSSFAERDKYLPATCDEMEVLSR